MYLVFGACVSNDEPAKRRKIRIVFLRRRRWIKKIAEATKASVAKVAKNADT